MRLDVVRLGFGDGLSRGRLLADGRECGGGKRGADANGAGVGRRAILAAVLALPQCEAGLAAISELLQLGVDAVGLVELDADLGGGPLAVGAGQDVRWKGGSFGLGVGRWWKIGGRDRERTDANWTLETTSGAPEMTETGLVSMHALDRGVGVRSEGVAHRFPSLLMLLPGTSNRQFGQ